MALNKAYDVFSNSELKQPFDNGEDPMDPMAGQGGSPFVASKGFSQGGHLWCDHFLIHYPLIDPASLVHWCSSIYIICCR